MDARGATWLLACAAAYAGVGLVFALGFVTWGAGRIDPVARDATRGFRIAILPGAALLWPWLAWRWRRATRERP
jgi:hypothetical protein